MEGSSVATVQETAMASNSSNTGELNYFTCTLGEAVSWNVHNPSPFHTINELIEYQAQHNPDRPAVGFCYDLKFIQQPNEWTWVSYSMLPFPSCEECTKLANFPLLSIQGTQEQNPGRVRRVCFSH